MNELTIDDIKIAMKIVDDNKPCKGIHNYEHSGLCPYCGLIWLGKEEYKDIMEILKTDEDWK